MIPSGADVSSFMGAVYQRGWMIDSQQGGVDELPGGSISKGMDD